MNTARIVGIILIIGGIILCVAGIKNGISGIEEYNVATRNIAILNNPNQNHFGDGSRYYTMLPKAQWKIALSLLVVVGGITSSIIGLIMNLKEDRKKRGKNLPNE